MEEYYISTRFKIVIDELKKIIWNAFVETKFCCIGSEGTG